MLLHWLSLFMNVPIHALLCLTVFLYRSISSLIFQLNFFLSFHFHQQTLKSSKMYIHCSLIRFIISFNFDLLFWRRTLLLRHPFVYLCVCVYVSGMLKIQILRENSERKSLVGFGVHLLLFYVCLCWRGCWLCASLHSISLFLGWKRRWSFTFWDTCNNVRYAFAMSARLLHGKIYYKIRTSLNKSYSGYCALYPFLSSILPTATVIASNIIRTKRSEASFIALKDFIFGLSMLLLARVLALSQVVCVYFIFKKRLFGFTTPKCAVSPNIFILQRRYTHNSGCMQRERARAYESYNGNEHWQWNWTGWTFKTTETCWINYWRNKMPSSENGLAYRQWTCDASSFWLLLLHLAFCVCVCVLSLAPPQSRWCSFVSERRALHTRIFSPFSLIKMRRFRLHYNHYVCF